MSSYYENLGAQTVNEPSPHSAQRETPSTNAEFDLQNLATPRTGIVKKDKKKKKSATIMSSYYENLGAQTVNEPSPHPVQRGNPSTYTQFDLPNFASPPTATPSNHTPQRGNPSPIDELGSLYGDHASSFSFQ